MKTILAEKQQQVSEFAAVVDTAHSLVAMEYSGLNSNRMNELRRAAREAGVLIRVMKNRLARRALGKTAYVSLKDDLKGHLLLALSLKDPRAAPLLVRDFIRRNPHNKVRLLALPDRPMTPAQLAEIADLPSPETAAARLLGVMQQPMVGLLLVLRESQVRLLRLLAAHAERGEDK